MHSDTFLFEEIFDLISNAESVNSALPRLLDRMLVRIGCKSGSIFILDPERKVLQLKAQSGFDGKRIGEEIEVPVGEGVVGSVAETGKSRMVVDVASQPGIPSEELTEAGITSCLALPIQSRGRVLGVLLLAPDTGTEISGEYSSIGGAVAHQIGVALDNAQLLLRSQKGESLYRHILDNASDLTILCDPDFRIVRMNREGLRFFQLEPERLRETNLEDLLEADIFRRFREERESLLHGSNGIARFEVSLDNHLEKTHIFEFRSTLIREKGERFFLHFIGRDLSRRKELEARLLNLTHRLAGLLEDRTTQLEETRSQITYLFDVVTRLDQLDTLDAKIARVVRSILAARLFQRAMIRINDRQGNILHSYAEGFSAKERESLETGDYREFRPGGRHPDGLTIIGASYLVHGAGESEAEEWMEGDLLVVPLLAAGQPDPIGHMFVDNPFNGRRPTPDMVQLVEIFVSQGVRAFEDSRIEQRLAEVDELRSKFVRLYGVQNLIGDTPEMLRISETVKRLAPVRTSVLITGESGTGKELVAGAIHYNGPRREYPFVKVNCGAIPETLLESELFGLEHGVATGVDRRTGKFERADGGTLFLDEVADMSMATQAKVLRALQERSFERVGGDRTIHVNVRIVAATNRDLLEEIENGNFRRDLYYRLNVIAIHLPPLRERVDDIALLVDYFLDRFSRELKKPRKTVSIQTMDLLNRYPWPGNVRQLENCIERALAIGREDLMEITNDDIAPAILLWETRKRGPDETMNGFDLAKRMELYEREAIIEALRQSGWVQKRAAEKLGISERSVWYRVKKLKIDIPS